MEGARGWNRKKKIRQNSNVKFKDARGKTTEKRSKVCPPSGSKKKDSCCDSDCDSGGCTILKYSKEGGGQWWWWEGKFMIRGKATN